MERAERRCREDAPIDGAGSSATRQKRRRSERRNINGAWGRHTKKWSFGISGTESWGLSAFSTPIYCKIEKIGHLKIKKGKPII